MDANRIIFISVTDDVIPTQQNLSQWVEEDGNVVMYGCWPVNDRDNRFSFVREGQKSGHQVRTNSTGKLGKAWYW